MQDTKLNVCILGSGKWGCAVAKLIGKNVDASSRFCKSVKLYVYDELYKEKMLTDWINKHHVNPKYLPDTILPSNIVAVADPVEAVQDADVVVFILRQQFLGVVCEKLKGSIKSLAVGISLTKSLYHGDGSNNPGVNELKCASDIIKEKLSMDVSVLMGPNLAEEIAKENFSETTVGCENTEHWDMWKDLFHCRYFKVKFSKYVKPTELCGALKNVVAAAAGLSDGLDSGNSAKAAVIRLGFLEMKRFIKCFTGTDCNNSIFWEPCGFADLIATCYGGMTRKVVEAFVKSGKPLRQVEIELFNGNVLEGPVNVNQVYKWLQERGIVKEYPLLCAVYGVFYLNLPFTSFTEALKKNF